MTTITVSATVHAPIEKVWQCWTDPKHIPKWNFASDDWESPHATNDLRVGGTFTSRMQAKDGSAGFDFGGTYTHIKQHELIEYKMEDGRKVKVEFRPAEGGTKVTEIFDAEKVYPEEMQKQGWQAILDNFKRHVEHHS
jgi:uncharacterized protein YndB with AHSA1/START domain